MAVLYGRIEAGVRNCGADSLQFFLRSSPTKPCVLAASATWP
jgi:hypothetical protein